MKTLNRCPNGKPGSLRQQPSFYRYKNEIFDYRYIVICSSYIGREILQPAIHVNSLCISSGLCIISILVCGKVNMVTLFIVLASGIVIKCVGANCDTTSTSAFAAMAAEGVVELVFVIKGMIKIFKVKDK